MRENEKVFYLYYDWIDDLDNLDGADAWEIVKAISAYHRNGENPVDKMSGAKRVIVSIMFNQIKRREALSEVRRNAVNSRYGNFVVQNATKGDFVEHERTTEYRIQNTSSFTRSIASARTCEGNEDGAADEAAGDLLPPEARRELEQHLKEDVKREYLGGTLGRGVVLLSGEQFDKLCDELSHDELEKYIGVVADCEESGKHYTNKTHYQAILEMARADRRV